MSTKSEIQTRSRVARQQNSLRRSPRFHPPEEKLNPEISFHKSKSHNKSIEIRPKSSSIPSKSKESASICGKNELNRSRSKSGLVLEETRSCPRRSPRLASQLGLEFCEIRLGFVDRNRMRHSVRLDPVIEENVKSRVKTCKASDELEDRKPIDLLSNEPESITKSKIVPKKKSKPLSSQIRRSSSRFMKVSNAVMNEGSIKKEEFCERFKDNRGDLVIESRIEDCFVKKKETEFHKVKRRRMDDDNGVESNIEKLDDEEFRVTVAWSNEQEEELRKAFLMAKPSPHFWKKVSKMVPGKSAQECFDKMHSSIATPLSPPPRSRTKNKSLSPILPLNLSTSIFPHISEIHAGRLRRCKTNKLAAHQTVRHLLRKHRLADQTKATDHFSLLELSPINIPVNVLNNISNFPHLSPQSGEKLSSNPKLFSRFKLLTTPEMDPSPQVLKQIKNRDLHDRYIDQLHNREARRLMLAKKSKFDDLDRQNCVSKLDYGALKAARTALVSDAKSFISHFKHAEANSMDELNADCSDDDDKDTDVSDFDE